MPLTPQEKQNKKLRDNLKMLHNRLIGKFNFKELKTWNDVYSFLGYSPEYIQANFKSPYLSTAPTYPELKSYLQAEEEKLEKKLSGAIVDVPFKEIKDWRMDESNNCTVHALSTILNIDYDKASALLSNEGKSEKGMRSNWLSEFLLDIGFELIVGQKQSLGEWIKQYPKGKLFVNIKDHSFALIDGIVYDHTKPDLNTKVESLYLWKGLKKKEGSVVSAVQDIVGEKLTDEKKQQVVKDLPNGIHDARDNYGYHRSPNVAPELFEYWFQKKAAAEAIDKIVNKHYRGILIRAGTGTGKTFIEGMIDRHLIDINYHENKTWSHIPRLCITKRTVVEQTKRVFKKYFNIEPNVDTEVINIEMLRSSAGQLWLKEETYIEGGQEKTRWVWKKNIHPCVVYFDESQGAKNKGSKQSQIIYAYNNIPSNTCLVSISATPFTRVSEAQAFAVSTHRPLDHLGFPVGTTLNNSNWPAYAAIIANPSKPDEYNQAAVERLMKDLDDYIVQIKGVNTQFKAINGVKVIQFQTPEQRQQYDNAYQKFLEKKAKLDALKDAGAKIGGECYLVLLLAFAMEAELIHAEHFADDMYEAWKRGKAPVAAVKFKQTLIKIVMILNEKYGISRDQISLIWGGGQTQLTEKQKAKAKIKEKEKKFKDLGIEVEEMLGDLGLDEVEDRVIFDIPEHLRLGLQDSDTRQREIDKFQSGKTEFALYTLKAGGVGLSLHHCDELTTDWNRKHPDFQKWYDSLTANEKKTLKPGKCRRKESGYAYEEDIKFIPVRPRETFMVVTYNAIELVQASGRVPRLTSLSDSVQNVYCYAGTIEMEMGRIYTAKFRCLSAVVKMHEDWQDLMFSKNRQQEVENAINTTKNVADDETGLIDESEIDDEDDNNENGNGK